MGLECIRSWFVDEFPQTPSNFHENGILLWDHQKADISRKFQIQHIPLLKLLHCSMRHVKNTWYNRETDGNTMKSGKYKAKSQHQKCLLQMPFTNMYNWKFLKISYKFLMQVCICVEDTTPLEMT